MTVSLKELRQQIDEIDDTIVRLLNRRVQLAKKAGEEKTREGTPLYDPEREKRIYERLESRLDNNPDGFPKESLRAIYREIIGACLSLESPPSVAFLGPQGTFSEMAARGLFGLSANYVEMPAIQAVFSAVERDETTFGVVPVENSAEGGVTSTLDCFLSSDVNIRREIITDVSHCLVGHPTRLEDVVRVYSHPQALAQCREWLARRLPGIQLMGTSSTSAAAAQAASDSASVAIASKLAAEYHGLGIIAEGIQDHPRNATRFVVLAKEDASPTGSDRTSLLFSTPDEQGALKDVLEVFDKAGVNLSRIESRPAPGKVWEYVFFADLEGHRLEAPIQRALEKLKALCGLVRVLGSYPRA